MTKEAANRIVENGEQKVSLQDQAKHAQAIIEAHRQSRMLTAQEELNEWMKKHNVTLESRQLWTNGIPAPAQIVIVPVLEPR